VQEDKLPAKIRLVAGVDAAYFDGWAVGAVAVLDYDSLQLVESQAAKVAIRIPYIPTLLSFREIPPAIAAIRLLTSKPDVFMADGQGLAHPYGCGFASHLGLAVGKPTIGVAKSRLVGEYMKIDDKAFLVYDGKVVSAVLTTKQGEKSIYVSVGNLVSLTSAVSIVEHATRSKRIPEPLLLAHRLATAKRKEAQKT
jgi:deoxyribonuclease V